MLLYEKKIGYLSVYQDGERKSSAGFLRIERERSACRLEIHIKKNAEVYNGNYMLLLITKDGELPWGTVTIRKEEAFAEKIFPVRGDMFCLESGQVREEDVCGIAIRLGEGWKISGCWKENAGLRRAYQKAEQRAEREAEEEEPVYREKGSRQMEDARGTGSKAENTKFPEKTNKQGDSVGGEEDDRPFAGRRAFSADLAESSEAAYASMENPALHAAGGSRSEDKWTRLQRSYKTVHPFGDERTFLSVELRDFHLLTAPYQRLANNSFLLHGFYNYRHLILGPDKELGDSNGFCFYLGVPGTYFEREKMVAVMFGFEGFECSGAVENGKFGYYMRRVEVG